MPPTGILSPSEASMRASLGMAPTELFGATSLLECAQGITYPLRSESKYHVAARLGREKEELTLEASFNSQSATFDK